MEITAPCDTPPSTLLRRRWMVRGQVQGVGYRPFIYRLAQQFGVTGFVRNVAEGVLIEGQACSAALEDFTAALNQALPARAVIRHIHSENLDAVTNEKVFVIDASTVAVTSQAMAEVTVDTALCPACRSEMLDTTNRRYGYGLINCTDCGPRYSLLRQVPYDRPNTTMAGFAMCPQCQAEYKNPADRRFHAQPIACWKCGPRVTLVDPTGTVIQDDDPILGAVWRLAEGQVLALKGIGGFHLAVRADDEDAVQRLRERKQRDSKPFALMCETLERAQKLVTLSAPAAALLGSPAAPIVLACQKAGNKIAPAVAPGCHRLGIMLPYTPLQHLLFDRGSAWWPALVMTSANTADEPLVITDEEALERLGKTGLCDAILWHDRPIERGVDDSVFMDVGEAPPLPVRRSRGYVPTAFNLPGSKGDSVPAGLCLGGELKNTLAVVREGQVVLSQHLGDLTDVRAWENFQKTYRDLQALLQIEPQWIAHDLHPLYVSTTEAKKLGKILGLPTLAVQHHHAHAAAVLAEHGHEGPVLAVVCDGTGYGPDGTVWGGELLVADLLTYKRVLRLRPLCLPGGDAAAKDTRRSALAWLAQAWGPRTLRHRVTLSLIPDEQERTILYRMIQEGLNCAVSSGAGRYFDAASAILGLGLRNQHEAQAAMALEAAAHAAPWAPPEEENLYDIQAGHEAGPQEIDLTRLLREMLVRLQAGWSKNELAALFHEEFARAWCAAVCQTAATTGLSTVALSGGVFCNQRLTQRLTQLLEMHDLKVLRHEVVPPNDGGLALGQAAVASAQIAAGLIPLASRPE